MLGQFTSWLLSLIHQWWSDFWSFFGDAALWVWDGVLGAISALVQSISVPAFMSAGLQSLFSGVDPGIMWLVSQAGIPAALGLIGAGYLFKVVRKFATVFLW